jgi:hypothetical protein
MAEFQWWLLLLGLVAGGGLVAVVYIDGARQEADLEAAELPAEAAWIAERLGTGADGTAAGADPGLVEQVLLLHAEYLQQPPPDRIVRSE